MPSNQTLGSSTPSPAATSSTFTTSASEGPRTPPAPASIFRRPGKPEFRRDSNSLRASVLNVFLELGALEENSQIAEWMFSDPNAPLSDDEQSASRSPPQRRVMFREQSGSRFRERLDSEGAGGLLDGLKWSDTNAVSAITPQSVSPTHSKASKFFARVTSKPAPKYNADSHRGQTENLAVSGIPSPIKKRPFVLFRSKTDNLKHDDTVGGPAYMKDDDAKLKEVLGGVPADPFMISSPRPILTRSRTTPSPSPAAPSPTWTCTEDGWEKVSPSPTFDLPSSVAPNPFLRGSAKNTAIPFPTGDSLDKTTSTVSDTQLSPSKDDTLLKRFSAVVSRPFLHPSSAAKDNERQSFLSLRRTRSRPPETTMANNPSSPLNANFFSFSAPVSPRDDSHALTKTLSH